MIPVIPTYITLVVLGAARARLTPAEQKSVRLGVGGFLGLWLALAIVAAPSLASLAGRDPYQLTLLIPAFGAGGSLLAILGYRRLPLFRRAVDGLSIPGVIGLQLFRTLGAVFLVLLAQGQLPAHFATPAGWGDVAVGVSAPVIALLLARGVRWPAFLWSVAGLTDLAVAFGMATGLATPLLPGVTTRLPAAAAMGAFPMILVPAFAVPVAILLHVVTLRGLASSTERVGEMVMAR